MGDVLFDSDLFKKENAITQLEELIKDMIKSVEKIGFSHSQAIDIVYTMIIEGMREADK